MARVVVIEDDDGVRRVISRVLQTDGHQVDEARDGEEGLRLVDAAPTGLVIVDLVMPWRDGIETIGILRRRHPSIPVLAISGGSPRLERDQMLVDASALGATEVLPKPFTPSELQGVVARLLSGS